MRFTVDTQYERVDRQMSRLVTDLYRQEMAVYDTRDVANAAQAQILRRQIGALLDGIGSDYTVKWDREAQQAIVVTW
jgi:hypothetical protein